MLSVEQISTRLSDRFALLTAGDRSAPPRQRTLRAAIEWSHDLLTARERALSRRLSVFAGWSLEAAEQVCADEEIPAGDVLDLTAALVDKSLVLREPEVLGRARYRMLETIREYAALRLVEAGESDPLWRRFRDYAVRTAERNLAIGTARTPAPWAARVDVFRRYDVEARNVTQVLNWCRDSGDAEAGLRIAAAISPYWIVRGIFTEGGEWLAAFLAMEHRPSSQGPGRGLGGTSAADSVQQPGRGRVTRVRGADAVPGRGGRVLDGGRAQPAQRDRTAYRADRRGGGVSTRRWRSRSRLATGGARGTRWVPGRRSRPGWQAAGGRAATGAAVTVMRRIDQQWGAARARLGLGDLARLRGRPGQAHSRYVEALPVLSEIGARPDVARCLAGLGRVAMELGSAEQARRYLSGSIQLSHITGARIGVVRGLEAFAALSVHEDRAELAVQLAAAAATLRETAGLPPLPGARTESYLTPARRLGDAAVARLWARGRNLSSDAAVALALGRPGPGQPAPRGESPALAAAQPRLVPVAPSSPLTRREHQIAALVAGGRSNKAIAAELCISPTTTARHVANIMAKLGFKSRAQIAAWIVGQQRDADSATGIPYRT